MPFTGQLLLSPDVARLLEPQAVRVPGAGRKRAEDQLDAITCAFAAYRAWAHGIGRHEVFGDPSTGCIVVPGARALAPAAV